MSTPDPVPQADAPPARQVFMQRIYLKDCSLEMPKAPLIFAKEVPPQVDVQVGTSVDPLSQNQFQVVLTVTVTAKIGEDTAFLCEVHQAGIFHLSSFANEQEVQGVLAAYCPGVLLPFARETIANLVSRTGYPAVMLQPINFEALYVQHLQQRAQQAEGTTMTDGSVVAATPATVQ